MWLPLVIFLLCVAANLPAQTFSDDFNRPDSPMVGNGWTVATDMGGPVILNGKLCATDLYGAAAIHRPCSFDGLVEISAIFTDHNGFGCLRLAHGTYFSIYNDGTGRGGYSVGFERSDENYSNSRIVLMDNGVEIATVIPTFEFGYAVRVDYLRFYPNGRVSGRISDGVSYFEFTFPARAINSEGPNVAIFIGGSDTRCESRTASTVDDFQIKIITNSPNLNVSGRVRYPHSSGGAAGVLVSLAGQHRITSGDGLFSFTDVSLILPVGNTITASKSGYMTGYRTVTSPAGAKAIVVSDIILVENTASSNPVVTSVEASLKGLFLSGVSQKNDFTAVVNWKGLTPGYVRFYGNGIHIVDRLGSGPVYSCEVDMASDFFRPSFSLSANKVSAQAVSRDGQKSAPFDLYVAIIPVPDPLKRITKQGWPFTTYLEGHVGVDFEIPEEPIKAELTLPVVGRFGFDVAAHASFDYTVTDGDWEAVFGVGAERRTGKSGRRPTIPGLTRSPRMKLYVGNKEISGELEGGIRGTATLQTGMTLDAAFGRGEIEGKLELGRVGLLDLLGPGLSTGVKRIPGLGDLVKNVSITIYVIPAVEGEITFAMNPAFALDAFEMTGKIGLEAAYQPKLTDKVKMRLYVGGEPSVTIQAPGELFKKVRFKAYAGAELEVWIFEIDPIEYVFVDVSYPSSSQASTLSDSILQMKVAGSDVAGIRPMSREYLKNGLEGFDVGDSTLRTRASAGPPVSATEAFREIGSIATKAGRGQFYSTPGSIAGLSQVDLTISTNVFPGCEPAMANREQELMLLYVTDNGSPNDLQFTDIRWTHWDGTSWSTPVTLHTNTQAEFAPQIAYDGSGNAIAVWERVADMNFNQTNLTEMAAQMEVVWSKWDRSEAAWSSPVALTSNHVLDHSPLLCGPMMDGSVLLVWTRNQSNLLMGTNDAGSEVLSAQWNTTSQSWSPPQMLSADLPHRLSQSLAGGSNCALYVWTRDLDGVLTNANDQQVFACRWTNGAWESAQQITDNSLGNRNARVEVASSGDVYLVWQRGSNLVMSNSFSTNVTMVRADSETVGFADYAMTCGPSGNLVLVWQEMSEKGSDAHYLVYDPVSLTWSKDARLFEDSALEGSFSPVWDNVGNLTVAYNKVQIHSTNKTVTLENGSTVTITNVPQAGRVDLCVTKRALVRDLALQAGDLGVSGDFLPGDAVILAATVRNAGNVGMSDIVVQFWDGDPSGSGTLITNVVLPGWLEGAATNVATALWIVPEPATNHLLHAIVNPSGLDSEFNELNNQQSVSVGGSDLATSLISYSVETNGAMQVIAQVHNLGAPSATNSVLAIRREGQTNAPLTMVAIPLLEPGRLAQVVLNLPAGTQIEGEIIYRLFADETGVIADVETNNNTTAFAVNLLLDLDDDGISDGWETMNGLDPHDPNDALLDNDADGLSNLAEYRAGTGPNDPASFLAIETIAANAVGTNGWVQITWGAQSNRLYEIQRASNLMGPFVPLSSHILSTPPVNTYLDTAATNANQFYYRLKLE